MNEDNASLCVGHRVMGALLGGGFCSDPQRSLTGSWNFRALIGWFEARQFFTGLSSGDDDPPPESWAAGACVFAASASAPAAAFSAAIRSDWPR